MRARLTFFGSVLSMLVSCGAPGRVHGPPSAALQESSGPPSSELASPLEPLRPPSPLPSTSSVNGPPFDRGAAASALAEGRRAARACGASGGPSGRGHVTVTFTGSGEVRSAALDSGPFAGTPVGECVARAYLQVGIVPFVGADVKVGNVFEVDAVTE